MIELLILNLLYFFILNTLKINSFHKLLVNIVFNLTYIFSKRLDLIYSIELTVFYISLLYLFLNIYLIRYSSLRVEILLRILKYNKIPTELWLYHDRKKRMTPKNTTFMKAGLFKFINYLVLILKKTIL
jgi:hypothetical protein